MRSAYIIKIALGDIITLDGYLSFVRIVTILVHDPDLDSALRQADCAWLSLGWW